MSNFVKKIFCSISVLVVLILILGCGNAASGRVSGVVKLDGKPLPDAAINFYPSETGTPAVGMTDANGRFELAVSHSMKGVFAGKYKVTISTVRAEQEVYDAGNTKIIPAVPEYVDEKLTNPDTTDLFKEVKSGKQEINFDLQSKPAQEN
ncbi:MAG: carboxypeptidase-like regulatory domain-containing protein [Planctomycetaceae bacterium]|jgi:uncharacterized membrane protein|nr:carboxypeptidase-like regulatory domain-containing protein [Planctomycetaceae bacterium]